MRLPFSKALSIVLLGIVATVFSAQAQPYYEATVTTPSGGNYTIKYLPGESSSTVWTYEVTENSGSKDLSHWVLGLCVDLVVDSYTTPSGVGSASFPQPDPTTGVSGIKWDDFTDDFSTGKFSITLDKPAVGGAVPIGVKSGGGGGGSEADKIGTGQIYGPLCIADPCVDDTTKPSWDGVVTPVGPGLGSLVIEGPQGLNLITLNDPETKNVVIDGISDPSLWSCNDLTCTYIGPDGSQPTSVVLTIRAPNSGGSFFFLEATDECQRTMRLDPALELWEDGDVPQSFEVEQNYPNPFNPTTSIRVQLTESSTASLIVFDMLGRMVKTLHNGAMDAGSHQFEWNGKDAAGAEMPSGMYIYRFESGVSTVSKQMLLLK